MNTAVASLSTFTAINSLRVDWFRVITDLELAGVKLQMQASHCQVAKGTVSYWKAGGEPKHCDGERLLSLFVQWFPDAAIPLIGLTDPQMVKNLIAT